MREIAKNSYYRSVDRIPSDKADRESRKRKLFLSPEERPARDVIIEDSTKYSRLKK